MSGDPAPGRGSDPASHLLTRPSFPPRPPATHSPQRWVKDARYTGAKYNTLITPKSGTPYTIWPVMHTELVRRKVRCVEPQEAHNAVSSGKAVLLDVRLPKQFEKGHADGAVNVPLYRITAGNKLWDKIKRIVMGGMVMDATGE